MNGKDGNVRREAAKALAKAGAAAVLILIDALKHEKRELGVDGLVRFLRLNRSGTGSAICPGSHESAHA